MEAPDILFFDTRYNTDEWPREVFPTRLLPTDVEYIRKDALMEWAKDELKLSKDVECVSEKSYEEGRQQVALNLIDKLNSM